jgi:hypothetical protein
MEEVTYKDFLAATQGQQKQESEQPEATYDEFLEDKKVKEWLAKNYTGKQKVENIPITPQLKKRYEQQQNANPNIQPTAKDLELTTTEKIAKIAGPAIAQTARFGAQIPESGANLYAGAGAVVDALSNLATPGAPRPANPISEFLYEQSRKGKKLSEEMAAPAKEFATTPAERALQDLGAGGFGLALEMPVIGKVGLPGYSGLTSYGGAKAAGASEEDAALAGLGGTVRGAGTHALFGLGSELPGTVLPKVATAVAMGGITKAEGGSWEDVGREALMAAILTGKKQPSELTKKELALLTAKDKERLWRGKQEKIQEQDVLSKFEKLPQEMTATEKAAELASLQSRAKAEFGEQPATKLEPPKDTRAGEIVPQQGAGEGISGEIGQPKQYVAVGDKKEHKVKIVDEQPQVNAGDPLLGDGLVSETRKINDVSARELTGNGRTVIKSISNTSKEKGAGTDFMIGEIRSEHSKGNTVVSDSLATSKQAYDMYNKINEAHGVGSAAPEFDLRIVGKNESGGDRIETFKIGDKRAEQFPRFGGEPASPAGDKKPRTLVFEHATANEQAKWKEKGDEQARREKQNEVNFMQSLLDLGKGKPADMAAKAKHKYIDDSGKSVDVPDDFAKAYPDFFKSKDAAWDTIDNHLNGIVKDLLPLGVKVGAGSRDNMAKFNRGGKDIPAIARIEDVDGETFIHINLDGVVSEAIRENKKNIPALIRTVTIHELAHEKTSKKDLPERNPFSTTSFDEWVHGGKYIENLKALAEKKLGVKISNKAKNSQEVNEEIYNYLDMAAPKAAAPVEKTATPIGPTQVPNQHATKVVDKVKEITNTTEELTEIMGESATHLKMNLAEQGRMASELAPDVARDIALGKRKAPDVKGSDGHFLKEEAVWVAEKNRAIERGDVEYLMELAKNSPVQEQISQAGKSLVLLRRNPHDPVYQIMEINKTAKETIEKNLGNKKVAETTTKRVAELERIIAEQTKKIEDYENRKTIKEFKYEARKRGRIRSKDELKLEFSDLVKNFEHLTTTQANIGLDPKVIKVMGRMAANRVEAGIKTIEQVVDDIYMAVGEKIDKRAIRDAITGYGKMSNLSKDEVDAELREVKRQGRLVSQLEDAEKGLAPLRSGLQRDKPSERVMELRRQVEDAMRKNGLLIEKELKENKKRIPPSEEERQLTAIEKYKNYIKKRTGELEQRLTDGDYSVKPRKTVPIDRELQNKKDHVSRLSKEYNKLKELNELRTNGVTKDEAANIIELSKVVSEKKNAIGDGSDRSANGAPMEYGRALYDFHEYANGLKQRAAKITAREWAQKATHGEFLKSGWKALKTSSGVSKSILSSMDNSAIGRQGIKTLWNHPGAWYKNAKQSYVDLFGKNSGKVAMREIMADVLSRPNAINGTYGKMKLDVGNIEEAYPTQAPEMIPGFGKAYKRAEAAFTGFQYRNRADVADVYLKIAESYGNIKGVDMTSKEQLESMGRLVNTLTGRGHLGKSAERAAESLNNVFFAPKFLKSNWDILTAHRFTNDTPFVKQQAALNLARFAAGTAAVMVVAKALGAKVEADPRSADFGKIRIGNTRFDITGGVGSVATFATRILMTLGSSAYEMAGGDPLNATKSSLSGKLSPLTTSSGFQRNGLDLLVDFARGKLAPGASILSQMLTGMDLNRKKLDAGNLLIHAVLPIGVQNAIENLSVKDKKIVIAAFLLDFHGIGSSTYGKEKKKTVWRKP